MLNINTIASLCLGLMTFAACGPTNNSNNATSSVQSLSELDDEDVVAGLGLAGLGDRVCRLNFSFVKKGDGGSYSVVGNGTTTDNLPRSGLGRGCLNFCVATFDELSKVNKANGLEILIKSCQFAEPSAPSTAVAPQPERPPQPQQPMRPTAFQLKTEACKIIQADQKLIFSQQKTRAECVAECGKRAQSNPQRRCEWGAEVLRQHPTNQCSIKGRAGATHYSALTNRFQCRMECKARADKAFRTCDWGGENVRE